MAIRDYFKKGRRNNEDRGKALRDPQQILAWLEELWRLRTPVELEHGEPDLPSLSAQVERVEEETRTVCLYLNSKLAREPGPGQRVTAAFQMDGRRFQVELAFQARGGYMEYRFGLPAAIMPGERRDSVRVPMGPEERLPVLAMQGLAAGVAFGGELVDLSASGCCLRIRRAVKVENEALLPIDRGLLAKGTPLALVRLPGLPGLPQVECGGELCNLRETEAGIIAGIRFMHLGSLGNGVLGKFLAGRMPGYVHGFPRKRRYRELAEEELRLPQPLDQEAINEEEALQETLEAAEEEDISDAGGTALTVADRTRLIRKRGKKILVLMDDDLERMLFLAALHRHGYRCLFEARSLVEALGHHRKLPLDCVVLDQSIGRLDAMRMTETFRSQGLPEEVPLVVVSRAHDVRLALAKRSGKVSLLLDRPVDYEGILKPALERMLGLAPVDRAC